MAEFVAPQFQNPDLVGSYLRGEQSGQQAQLFPGVLQGQQQELQSNGLKLDQLRLAIQSQKMLQQYASGALNGSGNQAGVSSAGDASNSGGTGGIQNGPQTASAQPSGNGYAPTDYNGPQFGQPAMSPGTMNAIGILGGDTMLKGLQESQRLQQEQRDSQMKMQQLKAAGPLNVMDSIAASPNPTKMVMNNPSIIAQWPKIAQQLGLDPVKDFTDENVARAAIFGGNQIRTAVGLPPRDMGYSGILKPGEAVMQNGRLIAGSADAVTPYQKQEMDLRKQENDLAQRRFAFEQNQSKVPTGYEVDPAKSGAIRPIEGGPKDPSAATAGGLGGRDGVMFNRVTSAANAGVKAIQNIAELPITTSSGWLSGNKQDGSLFGSVKSVLTQKMTGQEAQTANVMFAGLGRNLATLETAGLAPGGSLTHSLENLQLGEGDTQMTKLRKLAEMRQIVEENLSPNLSNPKLAPAQKELVQGIIDKVTKAVPFTQHDITQFTASKDPKATIMDFAKSSGVQAQADQNSAHPPAIQDLLKKYK